ncbi:MAG: tyrosine-type recombinase/integrase [Acetobacteraceae bacterium]|nr:tyrosine-type recombinase/integrase [Acetobacteraceae bacterium]
MPFGVRNACDLVGQMLSVRVAAREEAGRAEERARVKGVEGRLLAHMAAKKSFADGLTAAPEDLLRLAGAAGAAVLADGGCTLVGRTPPEAEVRRVAEWLAGREADAVKPLRPRTADEYRRAMERDVLPRLGGRPLRETTREDWTKLVAAKKRVAPAMASLLYRTASAFLGHAEAHGWVAASPLPRKGLAAIAPPLAARERVLGDDELRALWRASEGLNPKPRAFVRLLVLTAAREMEVADIAAGEVDLAAGRWTIPQGRTKNGASHTVPLCPLALAELAAVCPGQGAPTGPRRRLLGATGGGLRGFSKLKARLDALSGVTGWRWHDLRRTARTGMTRIGVPRDHAEAAINHVSGRSALERTYDRHDYAAEVVAALGRWQAHVAELVAPAASCSAAPCGLRGEAWASEQDRRPPPRGLGGRVADTAGRPA